MQKVQKIGRNDPCWCGSGHKYKDCHLDFDAKLSEYRRKGSKVPTHAMIKNPEQIAAIRESAKINVAVLDYVAEHIHAGISTEQIDLWVYEQTTHRGGIPAPLNYEGFPKSVCTSVNDQVCHGIPSADVILKDGDIVSLDAGTIYKGYHSDAARTWAVGNVSPEAQKLMDVTKQCFYEGIKFAKAGNHLNDISTAIQAYAEKFGYGVVRELVGHGIGTHLHEDPEVPNFATKRRGILLQPGMTLAIEPMINAGTPDVIWMDDDWTVVTADHALSAHYENTILITEGEPEILSLRPGLE